jgi:hypothetical protein
MSSGGVSETFVDGYGGTNNLVTINGFTFGPAGDTITFAVSDWGTTSSGVNTIAGLVGSDGKTAPGLGFATYVHANANTALTSTADIILDSISTYSNAAALQTALLTQGGNIILPTGTFVAPRTEVDILIAYATGNGINIADVTLNNLSGASGRTHTAEFTAEFGASLTVNDLIHITTALGLNGFAAHNIFFGL